MDEHAKAPLYEQDEWPEDYARWAERLWAALTPDLKEPKSLGWGSAHFQACDVVLELSSRPERRLTIRVIDALPDHQKRCYHGYHWAWDRGATLIQSSRLRGC
jgi:hypothetical protein